MNTQTALKRCFNYFMDMNHGPGYRDDSCVYYANGSKPVRCAIGCLIPPRFQKQAGEIEGSVISLLRRVPALEEVFADVDRDTLIGMQIAHDEWALNAVSVWMADKDKTTREDFLDHLQNLMCFHENEPA